MAYRDGVCVTAYLHLIFLFLKKSYLFLLLVPVSVPTLTHILLTNNI